MGPLCVCVCVRTDILSWKQGTSPAKDRSTAYLGCVSFSVDPLKNTVLESVTELAPGSSQPPLSAAQYENSITQIQPKCKSLSSDTVCKSAGGG